MIIFKIYESRTGAKRMPLHLSECKRFVLTVCKYKNPKKTLIKWFWTNHRLFKD